MNLKLLALLLLPLSAHAVEPWDSCVAGTAPMVRNPQGNEPGLAAALPPADYYPDEMQSIVESYQAGGCPETAHWTPTACNAISDNNNYVCGKQCQEGSTVFSTVYAIGGRVCGESSCPLEVGAVYPGDSFGGSFNNDDEACYEACTLKVHGIGLVINGSSQPSGPVTFEVTAATCDRTLRTGYDPAPVCETIGGQYVCQHAGEPTPCLEINGAVTCMPSTLASYAMCQLHGACGTQEEPVVTLSNSGQVAPSATPSPPAPDTGTAGTRASPDFSFTSVGSDGSSTSFDYWSPGTVAGSSTGSGNNSSSSSSGGSSSSGSGNSLSGGSDCDAAPTCSGDPIACYSAQQAWLLNCSQQPPTPAQLTAEAERFTDPTPEDGTILDRVTYDVTQLTVPYTPGACPSDIPIELGPPWNRTVAIPLSRWCELLTILGAFVHLSAALIALRILAS